MLLPFSEEPTRLLQKREHRAAVISVMTLLETKLTDILSSQLENDKRPLPMYALLRSASKIGFINTEAESKLIHYWMKRTRLVHGKDSVTSSEAKEIVEYVLKTIKSFEQAKKKP
jgi:hypothetical protein